MPAEDEVAAGVDIDDTTPLLLAALPKSFEPTGSTGRYAGVAGDEPEWPGQSDFQGMSWRQRPSIFWLIPPFLLFTLAFGGIAVPKLNLIKTLICRDYFADRMIIDPSFRYEPIDFGRGNDQCRIPEVQSRAVQFMLIGSVTAGFLSALTSPVLGALSDLVGRKRIIAVTTFGGLTGEIITIIAASKPEAFNVNWLMLSFFIDGLCGSFTTGMAVSHAYAADCTPPARRNVAFGYFHGVLFIGIALGPLIAGLVIKATGSLLPMFYIAFACHLFFLFCLIFIIPESLSKARQLINREKHAKQKGLSGPGEIFTRNGLIPSRFTWYNPLQPLRVLFPTGPGSTPALRRNMILLAAIDTTMFGVAMGSMTCVILYTDFQFHWDTVQQSYFSSIVNCCRVGCLFIVLPLLTRYVRERDRSRRSSRVQTGCDQLDLGLIRTAVLFDTLGYLGYTLARTGPLFILSGCIASLGGVGSPTLQSALTKHVPHDRVGELLGANGLLHALARIVAPVIFNIIYSKTVGKFTQAVFLCLTVAFGIAWILSLFVRPGVYEHDDLRPPTTVQDGESH